MRGEIEKAPYEYGTGSGCDFCVYRSVCGFQERIPGYEKKRLAALTQDEALERMRLESITKDETPERMRLAGMAQHTEPDKTYREGGN